MPARQGWLIHVFRTEQAQFFDCRRKRVAGISMQRSEILRLRLFVFIYQVVFVPNTPRADS